MNSLSAQATLPVKMVAYLNTAKSRISLRHIAALGLSGLALGLTLIFGMYAEQQRLWPRKYFITAQTVLLGKDLTRTNYKAKVAVWKDTPITQPVVMLGDSITEFADWAEVLQVSQVANRGIAKDTTEGLLNRIDASSGLNGTVFLMIGTNDIDQRVKPAATVDHYRKIVAALNARGNKVYAQSVLFHSAGDVNEKVAALNAEIKTICAQAQNCEYVDVNAKVAPDGSLPAAHTVDSVHPSAAGYQAWASVIKPKVDQAIAQKAA